jgi:excisionase family DNA binding protein
VVKLLDAKAVAEQWGIHEMTVRRFYQHGDLPVVRIGRSIRFDPDAVDAWAHSHGRLNKGTEAVSA